MNKQAIVIGLGQFGMALAHALSERGVEVLAVDVRAERVRLAAQFAAEAACFDATDEDALAKTSPERREICVCAIGDDSKEGSIIATALLRQMGAKRIIARSNDDVHARILKLVGAHHVVNPERRFGERLANQILYEGILGEMDLAGGLKVTELEAPESFLGRTLASLRLPTEYGVTVVTIRRPGKAVLLPKSEEVLKSGDVLVVVSSKEGIAKLMKATQSSGD